MKSVVSIDGIFRVCLSSSWDMGPELKKRLLITGFEPFGGTTTNPSAELIRDVQWLRAALPEIVVETALLPVTFAGAYEALRKRVVEFAPDVVIALGLAGGRDRLNVERVAINCMDAIIADNDGRQPVDEPICMDGPAALFATLPVRDLVDASVKSGIPAVLSNTAGTYVCNFVLYRLLLESRFTARRCGFIHLPYLPEQAAASSSPAMTLEQMRAGLIAMCKLI